MVVGVVLAAAAAAAVVMVGGYFGCESDKNMKMK